MGPICCPRAQCSSARGDGPRQLGLPWREEIGAGVPAVQGSQVLGGIIVQTGRAVPLLHSSRARKPPLTRWKSRLGVVGAPQSSLPTVCQVPSKLPASSRVCPITQWPPRAMGLQQRRAARWSHKGLGVIYHPQSLTHPGRAGIWFAAGWEICPQTGRSSAAPYHHKTKRQVLRTGQNTQQCPQKCQLLRWLQGEGRPFHSEPRSSAHGSFLALICRFEMNRWCLFCVSSRGLPGSGFSCCVTCDVSLGPWAEHLGFGASSSVGKLIPSCSALNCSFQRAETGLFLGPFLQNICFAEALILTSSLSLNPFSSFPSWLFVQIWGYQMTPQSPATCLVPVPAVKCGPRDAPQARCR